MSPFLGWIVFLAAVVLIGIIAFALIQWARTSEELAWAEAAFDDCDEKRVAAVRELQKLREARPDKARMVDYLDAVPVRRAGVLAAIREMQRVVAIGSDRSAEDLARDAIAIDVDGAVNFLALVPAVIRAVDQAIADLELERAAQAAIAGEPLDTRHIGEGGVIREIPIRTLGDVAAEAKAAGFADLNNPGPDWTCEPCKATNRWLRRSCRFCGGARPSEATMTSEGNEFAGRKAAAAAQVFDREDAPAGTKLVWTHPKVDGVIQGVQPTEAIIGRGGTWTLRRRDPVNPALPFRSSLEERDLSDQDMIERGFDLDALMAEIPSGAILPYRIDLTPLA